MQIIAHRRNTLHELQQTSTEYGVEVDIRSYGDELIIHHDPFVHGENFESWLAAYRHGVLILNVKEEGLEQRLLALMEKYRIANFFFLDQSFPFLIKTARMGERRCAVRVSEFESIETALALKNKVEWVWVDTFTRVPLTSEQTGELRNAGFKLCLVSGELQGRMAEEDIPKTKQLLREKNIIIDAVCTKKPELWL